MHKRYKKKLDFYLNLNICRVYFCSKILRGQNLCEQVTTGCPRWVSLSTEPPSWSAWWTPGKAATSSPHPVYVASWVGNRVHFFTVRLFSQRGSGSCFSFGTLCRVCCNGPTSVPKIGFLF